MTPALDVLGAVALFLLLAGTVQGIAGFGGALVGTMGLATLLGPTDAVVVMILPVLTTNLSLVHELGREELGRCLRRFWPYLSAAIVGTSLGMALLGRVPADPLASALGLLTLGYVLSAQSVARVPGLGRAAEICFRPGSRAKAALGFVSGIVFGASNIAVQVVAYLDALSLDRSTFVGVLAMVLVGISLARVGIAALLGLYTGGGTFALSIAAVPPALVGAAIGRRVRGYVPKTYRTAGALVLLGGIGLRLTVRGLLG